jgi:hypothetical protein
MAQAFGLPQPDWLMHDKITLLDPVKQQESKMLSDFRLLSFNNETLKQK